MTVKSSSLLGPISVPLTQQIRICLSAMVSSFSAFRLDHDRPHHSGDGSAEDFFLSGAQWNDIVSS
jgi:hypothetical protein